LHLSLWLPLSGPLTRAIRTICHCKLPGSLQLKLRWKPISAI